MRTPLRLSVPLARVRGGTGYSFELIIVADEAIRSSFLTSAIANLVQVAIPLAALLAGS